MGIHEYSLTEDSIAVIRNALNYSLWNDREITSSEHKITMEILDKLNQSIEVSDR